MIGGSLFATWGVGMALLVVFAWLLAAGAVVGQAWCKRWKR